MGFTDAIKTCFRKYATFSGRAPRSEFWWFVLFNIVVSAVLELIYAPLSGFFSLVTLLPYLAVSWRRLHDIDLSGWLVLLPMAGAPFIVIGTLLFIQSLMLFGAVVTALLTILLIVWDCKRGTEEDNRFGPSPLAPAPTAQTA